MHLHFHGLVGLSQEDLMSASRSVLDHGDTGVRIAGELSGSSAPCPPRALVQELHLARAAQAIGFPDPSRGAERLSRALPFDLGALEDHRIWLVPVRPTG